MINNTRLEAEKQRNKFVVSHSLDGDSHILLYTGDDKYRALDQYYSYSGKTQMFKLGKLVNVR